MQDHIQGLDDEGRDGTRYSCYEYGRWLVPGVDSLCRVFSGVHLVVVDIVRLWTPLVDVEVVEGDARAKRVEEQLDLLLFAHI